MSVVCRGVCGCAVGKLEDPSGPCLHELFPKGSRSNSDIAQDSTSILFTLLTNSNTVPIFHISTLLSPRPIKQYHLPSQGRYIRGEVSERLRKAPPSTCESFERIVYYGDRRKALVCQKPLGKRMDANIPQGARQRSNSLHR